MATASASNPSSTSNIHRSRTPEQIAERFESLTLDEIYATILYYLRDREAVSEYLARWLEHGRQARAAQEQDPSFQRLREKLRRARAERQAREVVTAPPTIRCLPVALQQQTASK